MNKIKKLLGFRAVYIYFLFFCCGCGVVYTEDFYLRWQLEAYFTKYRNFSGDVNLDIYNKNGSPAEKLCFQNEYTSILLLTEELNYRRVLFPELSISNYAIWAKYKDGTVGYAVLPRLISLGFNGNNLCTKSNDLVLTFSIERGLPSFKFK